MSDIPSSGEVREGLRREIDSLRQQLAEAKARAEDYHKKACDIADHRDRLQSQLDAVVRERDEARKEASDAGGFLASMMDTVNQELRENGPADVGQYYRRHDANNGVRYLVDLMRVKIEGLEAKLSAAEAAKTAAEIQAVNAQSKADDWAKREREALARAEKAEAALAEERMAAVFARHERDGAQQEAAKWKMEASGMGRLLESGVVVETEKYAALVAAEQANAGLREALEYTKSGAAVIEALRVEVAALGLPDHHHVRYKLSAVQRWFDSELSPLVSAALSTPPANPAPCSNCAGLREALAEENKVREANNREAWAHARALEQALREFACNRFWDEGYAAKLGVLARWEITASTHPAKEPAPPIPCEHCGGHPTVPCLHCLPKHKPAPQEYPPKHCPDPEAHEKGDLLLPCDHPVPTAQEKPCCEYDEGTGHEGPCKGEPWQHEGTDAPTAGKQEAGCSKCDGTGTIQWEAGGRTTVDPCPDCNPPQKEDRP